MTSLSYVPGPIFWRPTKIMNMRDLSKDDDFLSHLLVEKLGTGTVPLLVHKMDSSRRLPKTDADDLLQIVRRLVITKGPISLVMRQAVNELLVLPPIRYYLRQYTQKQINAFATHASRYFELYHPSGCIEIAHTSRYAHHTGKSELCILATRNLVPGSVITELKGSMANLTDEEDKELKRTDLKNSDIRRDFSVIHSKQMKKNHLFLGPARFVNHDCNNNCELFREGKYITFRVLRPISIGEEITAHYGDGYFGRKNRHCLCETCEKRGRGGYAPDHTDEDPPISSDSESDSSLDSDSDADSNASDSGEKHNNLNERRTRRGVYAVTAEQDSEDSDNEVDDTVLPAVPTDVTGEIELAAEVDSASDLTSLPPSRAQSDAAAVAGPSSLLTPGMVSPAPSALTALSPAPTARSPSVDVTPKGNQSTPFRSIISTRGQKTKDSISAPISEQLMTPPLTEVNEPAPAKRMTRSVSANLLASKRVEKGKQKASQASTPVPTSLKSRKGKEKEVDAVKKEETEPLRTLRSRPSVPAMVEVTKEQSPPKPEIPKGPDGKPLPTCSTCSNVLPVISVDHQVVWGLEPSTKKNKKKQDCPRCMRHLAIYGQPWPSRISVDGPFLLPTPREEATPVESASRRVDKKALSVLDRKLAAAAAAASVTPKKRKGEADERPVVTKRRKTEPVARVETTKALRAKGGRHSLPAPKVLKTYGRYKKRAWKARSQSPDKSNGGDESEAEVPKEEEVEKVEPKVRRKSKTSTPQPTLSRAQRVVQREKVRRWLQKQEKDGGGEKDSGDEGAHLKRSSTDIDDLEDHPRKKIARSKEKQLPLQKVLPRPLSGFRGGQLFSKPNPLNYALYAWASPVVSTPSSSSEDELAPVTPEDELTVDLPSDACGPIFPSPATLDAFKPSPFSFARRRWGSASVSVPSSQDNAKKRMPLRSPGESSRSDLSDSDKEPLLFEGFPPSSSPSPDSADAFLPLSCYPSPRGDGDAGIANQDKDRYSSPISSLPEAFRDNDESVTHIVFTPLSSPLHDSDSSPLPLLRRVVSPSPSSVSSPLSSLNSLPGSPPRVDDTEAASLGVGLLQAAAIIVSEGPEKPASFLSEKLVSSPNLVNADWDSHFSSPLSSPIESDLD